MATCEKEIEKNCKKIWKVQKIVLSLYWKKKTTKKRNTMNTISTILYVVVMLAFGLLVLGIFIQTNVELWNEVGKEVWDDMKSTVTNWFNDTKMGMWYKNKKNKVEILSDWEYKNLMKSGQIKNTIIVGD